MKLIQGHIYTVIRKLVECQISNVQPKWNMRIGKILQVWYNAQPTYRYGLGQTENKAETSLLYSCLQLIWEQIDGRTFIYFAFEKGELFKMLRIIPLLACVDKENSNTTTVTYAQSKLFL